MTDDELEGFVSDEPIEQPLEDFIDLHLFRPSDAADVVREYLRAAHEAGFRTVRIIHGKGTSTLKNRVERVLAKHPLVLATTHAPVHLGGWGATVVVLRE